MSALGGPALGVWGNSGMGVITGTLRAIDAWLPGARRLLVPPTLYFETRNLLPRLNRLLPQLDDDELRLGDIYYLDSVTNDDRFPLLERGKLHPIQLMVFDTTCYDAASPLIARVVERCRAERVPLFLLRSHMKLDLLGTEYARLGSAVLWLPPRPSPVLVKMAKKLRRALNDELALAGAMPTPLSFWPVARDARLRSLTARRNARMVEAQARATDALRPLAEELTAPHHGCFFMVPTRRRHSAQPRQMSEVAARLNAGGIEARTAASFGYDLVGVTVLNLPGAPVLRISLPDLPDVEVDRAVELLADYFKT